MPKAQTSQLAPLNLEQLALEYLGTKDEYQLYLT